MCNNTKKKWLKANNHLSKLEKKYFDLVWYARSDKDKLLEDERYEILSILNRIESEYKQETDSLYSDDCDWSHGFNSGVLSTIRLIQGLMEDDFDASVDEFPFLDT